MLMFDQIEPTLINLAADVKGWTTVEGPMSLAVRQMKNQGLVVTQNDEAPAKIEYKLTEAGRARITQ